MEGTADGGRQPLHADGVRGVQQRCATRRILAIGCVCTVIAIGCIAYILLQASSTAGVTTTTLTTTLSTTTNTTTTSQTTTTAPKPAPPTPAPPAPVPPTPAPPTPAPPGPELCKGEDVSGLSLPHSALCFCFYGGRCQSNFHCHAGESAEACQQRSCGSGSLEVTDETASFFNRGSRSDVLTVPIQYFRDIRRLSEQCPDNAVQLLVELLAAGRRVFVSTAAGGPGSPAPETQCVHLYPHLSVPWLHVHTFIGRVRSEGLPGVWPLAACVSAALPEDEAAAELLRLSR
eukprot:gb/GFBE01083328.1/.p1 GENE.gb/GFBE01083328.1/~~gb/GFBE01083328.1/.p1  ORF type:complete len:289 (+),score=21.18 gb/GFBE01083328.1/:1-867(+)